MLIHFTARERRDMLRDPMPEQDISRRKFLEASVAAGAAAVVAPALAQQVQILEPPNKPVRVGVVGIGARGHGLTATLLAIPGVEINAVCDIDEKAARGGQKLVEDKAGKKIDMYTKGERDWENLVA